MAQPAYASRRRIKTKTLSSSIVECFSECGSPEQTNAVHERLVHFTASPAWRDHPVRLYAARYAVSAMEALHGLIQTWIVDDTRFLKQGKHSPGVQRQYTSSAGKTTNCQIGVSLVLATEQSHVASDFRLCIPESRAEDRKRCRRAHIPDDVLYEQKWALALSMIEDAIAAANMPKGGVLGDSDYGTKTVFRDSLDALGLQYAVEVHGTTVVRRVGKRSKLGKRLPVAEIGAALQAKLRTLTWREGTKAALRSRFARIRVVVDRDDGIVRRPEWLLVEWPEGEPAPTTFYRAFRRWTGTTPAQYRAKQRG